MLLKRSPTIEKYLERASDCELMAQRAYSQDAKRNFHHLAAEWRRLAESAEHVDRTQDFLRGRD